MSPPATAERLETLSERRLNRALLARQHLLERAPKPLGDVIDDIGGLQTQYAPSGYISLWSRMAGFERRDLTAAMERREVIHGTLMRVTIHSVTAHDYWPMAIGIRDARRDWLLRTTAPSTRGLDVDALARATRAALAAGPLKARELKQRIVGAGFSEQVAGYAGLWVDLVRIPPCGTWERRANDIYELADRYLPPAEIHPEGIPTEDDGLRLLLVRYLKGFGPAKPADFASWAGVTATRARPIIDSTELRRFRDEQGRVLIDLPEMALPSEDTPAPIRFLPQFDPTLLINCRRTQILPEALRPIIFNTKVPWSIGTILVDGQVAATWRFEDNAIRTRELVPLSTPARRELAIEAD
jgi:hypothetical protein